MAKTFSMITGTGHYLPERVLSNRDLESIVNTTDEWITKRVGIKERHIIGDSGEITSDLGARAAEHALQDSGITAKDLDAIIVATVTGDMKFPSTAVFIQKKLGASNAVAFDISAACTGFIYGIDIADGFIVSGKFKNILVIGVECLTSMINWDDRSTAVLFGDGAGAAVIQPSDGKKGLLGSFLKSDGNLAELLWSKGGGTYEKTDKNDIQHRRMYIRMEGNRVFKHAVRAMLDAANTALDRAGLTGDDIDLFIPHQANLRIINAVAERIRLPREKIYINLYKTGNTSAASIPIAMDQARKEKKLHMDSTLLISAFGGGFTWGGAVIAF